MSLIVGSGLIARNLACFDFPSDYVFLAAGVSNSAETLDSEFRREIDLVEKTLAEYPDKTIVYFSTCSVYQSKKSKYIEHKLYVESLIEKSGCDFLVFRLPQVVGDVLNNTLISYLVSSVYSQQKVFLQKNAFRNIIDVTDVVKAVYEYVSSSRELNRVIDIAGLHKVSVIEISGVISELLDKPIIYEVVAGGEAYDIPTSVFMSFYSNSDSISSPDYWRVVLKRYVPLILRRLELSFQ